MTNHRTPFEVSDGIACSTAIAIRFIKVSLMQKRPARVGTNHLFRRLICEPDCSDPYGLTLFLGKLLWASGGHQYRDA